MKRYLTIAVILLLAFAGTASAQKVAVKTNALYWATTTPNIGIEFSMGPRWTFEIAGGYNPFILNKEKNMKAKVILLLHLFGLDVLLLGLIERILDALTKKLTELKDLVSLEAERLKSKRK